MRLEEKIDEECVKQGDAVNELFWNFSYDQVTAIMRYVSCSLHIERLEREKAERDRMNKVTK